MNQESLIKGLSFVAAVALVGFIVFTSYKVYWESRTETDMVEISQSVTLDSNESLRTTLDTLETIWERKQAYIFKVKQDPLFLGRVVHDFTYAAKGSREIEEETKIRLTATVIDENPKAIIKYAGKSHVVQVGDLLGNEYKVEKIEKKQVVLVSGGKKMVITNKPLKNKQDYRGKTGYSDNAEYEKYNY